MFSLAFNFIRKKNHYGVNYRKYRWCLYDWGRTCTECTKCTVMLFRMHIELKRRKKSILTRNIAMFASSKASAKTAKSTFFFYLYPNTVVSICIFITYTKSETKKVLSKKKQKVS